jgi:AcrR family transcriptional regulator
MPDDETTRDRVLREAEQALLEQGFFGVSMRQVALNAGVHPGTVLSLFGNKRNLLKTVEAHLQEKQAKAVAGARPL